MIDHIGVRISSYERSKRFYDAALAPLGIKMVMELTAEQTGDQPAAGYGDDQRPRFWIGPHEQRGPLHVAFSARDNAMVDAFYQSALAAGGKDNGAPGPRPHYHASYYGAFVLDPDGNNIEAVCHHA